MIAGIVSPETCQPRPELRDERADGPCDLCAKWKDSQRGECCRCGEAIGMYENMGGAGFQSPKPHHYHLEPVLDVMGRRAVFEELCLDCYREAWHTIYPNEAYPPAPMKMTEAKLPPDITRAVVADAELTGTQ